MYEWVKVLHIISFISWMAGLLYLPRLFIYHFDAEIGGVQSETFKVMEQRLLRVIMTPAMLATWIFGLWLMIITNAYLEAWFICKFFLVFFLSGFHGVQVKWIKEFASDERKRSTKVYRVANEVPTVLMILIVILVVVKPF